MTWIDKLREALPNSEYVRYIDETIIKFCPYKFFGGDAPNYNLCLGVKCKTCWNREAEE